MKLMLAAIFLFVALGLLAPRLGARQHAAILGVATMMTALYYFLGERLM